MSHTIRGMKDRWLNRRIRQLFPSIDWTHALDQILCAGIVLCAAFIAIFVVFA